MAYANTNASGWATTGDYPSESDFLCDLSWRCTWHADHPHRYQCLGLWLTDCPEVDNRRPEDFYRQTAELNLMYKDFQLPDYELYDDTGGECSHPGECSYCRTHSPHGGNISAQDRNGAGAMQSDGGVYTNINSQRFNTQVQAPLKEEEQRSVSMPPAMEWYVQDLQRHELLAVNQSNNSFPCDHKSKTRHEETPRRAGLDKISRASGKSVMAKRQSTSSGGGKHGHSG